MPLLAAGALAVQPALGSQLGRVLSAYRAAGVHGLTDREVHDRTWIPIHLIPARRRELQDRGLVDRTPLGKRRSTTGVMVNIHGVTATGR